MRLRAFLSVGLIFFLSACGGEISGDGEQPEVDGNLSQEGDLSSGNEEDIGAGEGIREGDSSLTDAIETDLEKLPLEEKEFLGEDGGTRENHGGWEEPAVSEEPARLEEPDGFQEPGILEADQNEGDPADRGESGGDGENGPGLPQLLKAVDISVYTETISDPEVDCLWEDGYRHVIAGTQLPEVTRQQVKIAVRGGMTVDLYVYLLWNVPIDEQIQGALVIAAEYPQIKRIWIDVEEDPAGRSADQLQDLIQSAVDNLGGYPGGIYSNTGFWKSYFENRQVFSELPLWYSHYDGISNFDDWYNPEDDYYRFGGWTDPWGKQFFSDEWPPGVIRPCSLCADQNIMWIDHLPWVVVDRSIPPDDGRPPDAPLDLHPGDGFQITIEYVGLTAPAVRESTSYDMEIEYWNPQNLQWQHYFDPIDLTVSAYKFSPSASVQNRAFCWRIRATNQHGDGPWSEWAWFKFGNVQDLPTLECSDPRGSRNPR